MPQKNPKPQPLARRRTVSEGLIGHRCVHCRRTIQPGEGATVFYARNANVAQAQHSGPCPGSDDPIEHGTQGTLL